MTVEQISATKRNEIIQQTITEETLGADSDMAKVAESFVGGNNDVNPEYEKKFKDLVSQKSRNVSK